MAEAVVGGDRRIALSGHALRSLLTLVGIAAAIAAALWLVLWSQGPNYTQLFGPLSPQDSVAVVDVLTAEGIPNRLEPGTGIVLVPADRVQDARLKLASKGLPEGDGLGIEMLKKDESSFGGSQFMESARYQLALETEIARTIVRVQGVQAARVHLALPKPSAFVRDRRRTSASVMLQLQPGVRLDENRVAAITHLVASSVPDLESKNVTVLDQSGTLLSAPAVDDAVSVSSRQLDYQRRVEGGLEERIVSLLTPLVGAGRVRASVTAELDFASAEHTSESFDPGQQIVRSEQTSSDLNSGGDLAQGIPGALSNRPPVTEPLPPPAAAAASPAPAPAAAGATRTAAAEPAAGAAVGAAPDAPLSSRQQATRNYEIGRTVTHVQQPSGAVKRLSIAVLVDGKPAAEEGQAPTPYGAEELERMTALVRDAVGLDEARGDKLRVSSIDFLPTPTLEPPEEVPVWKDPGTLSLARQGLGALLVLAVAFFVLRPLMNSFLRPAPAPLAGAGGPAMAGDRLTLSAAVARDAPDYDKQVTAARNLVSQDPRRAAEVVKNWVAN
jgi:flagellar M-ring protein FliF